MEVGLYTSTDQQDVHPQLYRLLALMRERSKREINRKRKRGGREGGAKERFET